MSVWHIDWDDMAKQNEGKGTAWRWREVDINGVVKPLDHMTHPNSGLAVQAGGSLCGYGGMSDMNKAGLVPDEHCY